MNKTKYYAGFKKNTMPYKSGYMIIDAVSINDAVHIMNLMYPGCKNLPTIITEPQMKRMKLSEFCDYPCVCRGEFAIYKETSEQVFYNIRMNIVTERGTDIYTGSRVAIGGE